MSDIDFSDTTDNVENVTVQKDVDAGELAEIDKEITNKERNLILTKKPEKRAKTESIIKELKEKRAKLIGEPVPKSAEPEEVEPDIEEKEPEYSMIVAKVNQLLTEDGKIPNAIMFSSEKPMRVMAEVENPDHTAYSFQVDTVHTRRDYFRNMNLTRPICSTGLLPMQYLRVTKCNAEKIHVCYID